MLYCLNAPPNYYLVKNISCESLHYTAEIFSKINVNKNQPIYPYISPTEQFT
jgi:hypothetical protein